MKIKLVSVASKMPKWVEAGYQEFAKRLPKDCALELIEIPLSKRGKNADINRLMNKERDLILAKIQQQDHVCALEVNGKPHTTSQLAERLDAWKNMGKNIVLLVGGPEGLHQDCRDRANELWSLSNLTLPHPIVRIVLAETLYRAWSVNAGHPYHRE
jgi:23S rRNA (pseudouridine1915-N3)-methyltransferase